MDRRAIIGALVGIAVTAVLILPLLPDRTDNTTAVSHAAPAAPAQAKPYWDDLTSTDDLAQKKVNVDSLMLAPKTEEEAIVDPKRFSLEHDGFKL